MPNHSQVNFNLYILIINGNDNQDLVTSGYKKTNYIVCFKTLKKEKKKEGKTVQEPKLLLVPE
jgi:hypothetical protein